MDNVLPKGIYVKFDADNYLEENYLADSMDQEETSGEDLYAMSAREQAEIIQKIYLGVNKVITADEARAILNEAGLNLPIPSPTKLPVSTP